MKASKFNMFFPHEEYQVGYNGFSNEFIILEPYLYELYKAAKNADFEELSLHSPDFYNLLKEKEFFINDDIDEVDRVRQMSKLIDNDDTKFKLHINPTMNCNFKCWYCYETHIKDSKMDLKTIANTEDFVKQVFENKKSLKEFSLSWFGGEPLLYFHKVVVPILKSTYEIAQLNGVNFHSAITTNGLLIDQTVIDLCLKYNLNFFQITLDGNREKHDKVRFISEGRGSYDKIVENIYELAKNRITVNIRINISVETLEGITDIVNDFAAMSPEDRKWIHFDLHKVWQVESDIDNEINENRWLFRNKGFVVSSGAHDTVINSCYGDHKNHATINFNGEVFKCTARDFTTANSEGILKPGGFIEWNEKLEKRLNSKFKNKPCLECPILPLCGGGCTQQAIEHENVDYCVYDFDNNKKLDVVKNKFFEILADYA
ncbi:radical SAM/SPASM domain-containing protein [Pedobacter borealis]|uniref:radical SAM/SPASM domain-containing protein n=1 Tax=Pedobacter borealis TaxID=475254 RepID=UPI0004939679|nr:radical SAM protein [Pedobacter borealis]